MIKDVRETFWWIKQLVFNPPLVWEGQNGEPDDVEQASRRFVWGALKPRWMTNAFLREMPCGCSSRFHRMARFRVPCEIHVPELSRMMAEIDAEDADPAVE